MENFLKNETEGTIYVTYVNHKIRWCGLRCVNREHTAHMKRKERYFLNIQVDESRLEHSVHILNTLYMLQ
jgi:hypothetical protein